jgi:hypothetical protein
VIDEGHRLKNAGCKLARELRAYRSRARLLLTGDARALFVLVLSIVVGVHGLAKCFASPSLKIIPLHTPQNTRHAAAEPPRGAVGAAQLPHAG